MMNYDDSTTDRALVRLAQQGNLEAYDRLLSRYHYKVKQMVAFNISDSAQVNDLVQNILLKVFLALPEFKEDSKFSTWLYRIVQNTIKNHFRTSDLRVDSETLFAQEYEEHDDASPEYQLMDMEMNQILTEAILKLSDELRLSYSMYLFEQATYADIAKKMKCPLGTVRSRIHRARQLIRDYISALAIF